MLRLGQQRRPRRITRLPTPSMCVPASVAQRQQQGRTTIGAPSRGRHELDVSRRTRSLRRRFATDSSHRRWHGKHGNTAVATSGNQVAAVLAPDRASTLVAYRGISRSQTRARSRRALSTAVFGIHLALVILLLFPAHRALIAERPGIDPQSSEPTGGPCVELRYSSTVARTRGSLVLGPSRHALAQLADSNPGRDRPGKKAFRPI
jgi:hypothetical protein